MQNISRCQSYFCYFEWKQSSEFNMDFKNGSCQLRTAFSRNTKSKRRSPYFNHMSGPDYCLRYTILMRQYLLKPCLQISQTNQKEGMEVPIFLLIYLMRFHAFHTNNFFDIFVQITLTMTFSTCNFFLKEYKYMIFGIGNIIVTRIGQIFNQKIYKYKLQEKTYSLLQSF